MSSTYLYDISESSGGVTHLSLSAIQLVEELTSQVGSLRANLMMEDLDRRGRSRFGKLIVTRKLVESGK